MKNLSLTQQYLLCVLNKNGKLPAFGLEKTLLKSFILIVSPMPNMATPKKMDV